MTASYGPLAAWYDALTRDVDYAAFADFYERQFQSAGGEMRTLLDLCCGTGTLTCLLAERGYEMIAADASPDMLMQAREKAASLPEDCVPPLLLCQSAEELDLYGTVDAAVCSLDGFDYLAPESLPEVLHRLHLFIRTDRYSQIIAQYGFIEISYKYTFIAKIFVQCLSRDFLRRLGINKVR